jgi:hypothetical protein
MKRTWLATILLVAAQVAVGQITYEPGYIISSDGKRTECEIKNMDWKSNPTTFEYRVNGAEAKGDLETISEFGVTGGSVFRRFSVAIDRSTSDIGSASISKTRNPEFKQEKLFLRLLLSGKAVLYMYEDHGLTRFFYSLDGAAVSQLVYKRFMQISDKGFETGYAGENEQYKQTLFTELKCASISQRDAENLKYERAALMKFFDKYNSCTGSSVQTHELETPASPMHIRLLAGVGFNTLTYTNGSSTANFDAAAAWRLGAEFEVVLPFNKGLWSVWLQPVYQSYSNENDVGTIKVDYKSLDIGGGLRRYFSKSDKRSVYANLGAVYALPIGGAGAIKYPTTSLDIASSISITAGIGFEVSKFRGEVGYGFGRGLLGDYVYYTSSYSGPMITLGYRLK